MFGYDNITPQAPLMSLAPVASASKQLFLRRLREIWARAGYSESYNYSFAAPEHNRHWHTQSLTLRNPLVAEKNELRLSLLPGLLEQTRANQDRFAEVRLFEIGRVYWPHAEQQHWGFVWLPENVRTANANVKKRDAQHEHLLAALLELRQQLTQLLQHLGLEPKSALDLGDAANNFEYILPNANLAAASYQQYAHFLHPNACLVLCALPSLALVPSATHQSKASNEISNKNEQTPSANESRAADIWGSIGLLHPSWERKMDLKRPALVGELNLERIYACYAQVHGEQEHQYRRYSEPSIYPPAHFEISLLLPTHSSTHEPLQIIRKLQIDAIQNAHYLTEYSGPPLADGQRSVSYAIQCQRQNGTLQGHELQQILDRIVAELQQAGFALRT